jgi:hypothetical protein
MISIVKLTITVDRLIPTARAADHEGRPEDIVVQRTA